MLFNSHIIARINVPWRKRKERFKQTLLLLMKPRLDSILRIYGFMLILFLITFDFRLSLALWGAAGYTLLFYFLLFVVSLSHLLPLQIIFKDNYVFCGFVIPYSKIKWYRLEIQKGGGESIYLGKENGRQIEICFESDDDKTRILAILNQKGIAERDTQL